MNNIEKRRTIDHTIYVPILLEIKRIMQEKEYPIIAIDGRCGSGKTKLAEYLHRLFPSRVLHMDDYYLPMNRRTLDWEEIPGGNMDFTRFLHEALLPASKGKALQYIPYSCKTGEYLEKCRIDVCPLTIVEGSYSQHPSLASYYDYKVFLTCSNEVQLERIKRRDGERHLAFQTRWIPLEERYFTNFHIENMSDISIDTSCCFEY